MDDPIAAPPLPDPSAAQPQGPDATVQEVVDPSAIQAIDHYELDGIPLYHMPTSGTTLLTLAFGVGRADEPVVDTGMTHLAEHLLLTSITDVFDHANGTTEAFRVTFVTRGTPKQVSKFLRDVCAQIEQPRLSRMFQEANVLRNEAAGRGPMSLSTRTIYLRTGYQGVGNVMLPEFFLDRLDEQRLREWIATNLVAGNAAIWIAGQIPDDLEVFLPPGPARPPAGIREIDGLETPTAVIDDAPGVGASFLVRRTVATVAALQALNRQLIQRLRVDRGLAYDIGGEYLPLNPDQAYATVGIVCQPEATRDVQRALLESIDDIANRGPIPQQVSSDYQRWVRDMADPRVAPGRLDAHVRDVLLGDDPAPKSVDAMVDEQWRLESDAIAVAMREARESMLLYLPITGEDPQRPLHRYPATPVGTMEPERAFDFEASEKKRFRRSRSPVRLTVGRLGLSVDTVSGERIIGILWHDVVGIVRDQRARSILSRDGSSLVVLDHEWRDGPAAIRMIDQRTPKDLVIDRGARR
jgi:hypothetical protein